jgi:hypothetical protein
MMNPCNERRQGRSKQQERCESHTNKEDATRILLPHHCSYMTKINHTIGTAHETIMNSETDKKAKIVSNNEHT